MKIIIPLEASMTSHRRKSREVIRAMARGNVCTLFAVAITDENR